MCTQDEVDPGTEKARKELEERLVKRKAEKKETEERLEKQRAEKQEQEGILIRVLTLVELVIALVIRKAISEVTTRAKQAIVTINGKYPIC